jgi:hypothetical protein
VPPAPGSKVWWRDPALLIAVVAVVIGIFSAFYSHEQASIGRQQLERQTKLERQKALGYGVHLLDDVQGVLGRCLANELSEVEACGAALSELRDEASLAAADPTVATDYPLLRVELRALSDAVNGGKTLETIRTAANLQRRLATVARDLHPYDGATHLRLALHANDLEVDAALISRFAPQTDTEGRELTRPVVTTGTE